MKFLPELNCFNRRLISLGLKPVIQVEFNGEISHVQFGVEPLFLGFYMQGTEGWVTRFKGGSRPISLEKNAWGMPVLKAGDMMILTEIDDYW